MLAIPEEFLSTQLFFFSSKAFGWHDNITAHESKFMQSVIEQMKKENLKVSPQTSIDEALMYIFPHSLNITGNGDNIDTALQQGWFKEYLAHPWISFTNKWRYIIAFRTAEDALLFKLRWA